MKDRYDTVIVGARCAGAALATYLSRAGASVLLLDKSRLPSDQVLSTHTLHPAGMDVLDEVGIGADIRRVSPPMHVMRSPARRRWGILPPGGLSRSVP